MVRCWQETSAVREVGDRDTSSCGMSLAHRPAPEFELLIGHAVRYLRRFKVRLTSEIKENCPKAPALAQGPRDAGPRTPFAPALRGRPA
jgi:hypothetical protein